MRARRGESLGIGNYFKVIRGLSTHSLLRPPAELYRGLRFCLFPLGLSFKWLTLCSIYFSSGIISGPSIQFDRQQSNFAKFFSAKAQNYNLSEKFDSSFRFDGKVNKKWKFWLGRENLDVPRAGEEAGPAVVTPVALVRTNNAGGQSKADGPWFAMIMKHEYVMRRVEPGTPTPRFAYRPNSPTHFVCVCVLYSPCIDNGPEEEEEGKRENGGWGRDGKNERAKLFRGGRSAETEGVCSLRSWWVQGIREKLYHTADYVLTIIPILVCI